MPEWVKQAEDVYTLVSPDGGPDLGRVTPNRGRWFAWVRIDGAMEAFSDYDFQRRSDAMSAVELHVKAASATQVESAKYASSAATIRSHMFATMKPPARQAP